MACQVVTDYRFLSRKSSDVTESDLEIPIKKSNGVKPTTERSVISSIGRIVEHPIMPHSVCLINSLDGRTQFVVAQNITEKEDFVAFITRPEYLHTLLLNKHVCDPGSSANAVLS